MFQKIFSYRSLGRQQGVPSRMVYVQVKVVWLSDVREVLSNRPASALQQQRADQD